MLGGPPRNCHRPVELDIAAPPRGDERSEADNDGGFARPMAPAWEGLASSEGRGGTEQDIRASLQPFWIGG